MTRTQGKESMIHRALAGAAVAGMVLGAAPARAADNTVQCIAASEKGLELRKAEKLLDARRALSTCATTECPDEIKTVCEARIAEINSVLPSVLLDVKDGAGVDRSDVKLSIDGAVVATQLGGRSIPLDPGKHAFSFEVPGQPRVDKTIVLEEGDRERRMSIVSGAPPESGPFWTTRKKVALVVGGVGVVGLGLGSVFGLSASSKWSSAKSDCGSGCASSSPAQSEKSDAQSAATVATVAFGVGAAAVAGALVLWLLPSHRSEASGAASIHVVPVVGDNQGGLSVGGLFE